VDEAGCTEYKESLRSPHGPRGSYLVTSYSLAETTVISLKAPKTKPSCTSARTKYKFSKDQSSYPFYLWRSKKGQLFYAFQVFICSYTHASNLGRRVPNYRENLCSINVSDSAPKNGVYGDHNRVHCRQSFCCRCPYSAGKEALVGRFATLFSPLLLVTGV
jgi:hypothetical protein